MMSTPKNGIDVDRAPPNVAIAYDRYEGYFGPAYETGALAPVVARLESNTSVFAPKIRQLYATGDAAALVTQEPTRSHEKAAKSTDKRVAFFGTGSVVGLKVAFDPNRTPQSLTLGYKRKEFSLISGDEGRERHRQIWIGPRVLRDHRRTQNLPNTNSASTSSSLRALPRKT